MVLASAFDERLLAAILPLAVLWAAAAAVLAVALGVRLLLGWVRHRRAPSHRVAAAADRGALFRRLAEVTPRVLGATAPRGEVCDAARVVAGADAAWLVELDAAGGLVCTAAVGPSGATPALPPGAARPGGPIAAALESGRARLVPLEGPVRTLHLTPVHDAGGLVGVLAVGWGWDRVPLPEQVAGALQVLAAEAAVALERANLLHALRAQARRDVLTGLPNRREWDERLAAERARARREGQPFTVALLDLDHFKRYNDLHGHPAGDVVLREAAAAWRGALRVTDLLARWGGEEFALLLPGCRAAEAVLLLDRVRGLTPRGQTCSAGLAEWDGREDADELIARADAALYEAKGGGRDRTVVAGPSVAAPDLRVAVTLAEVPRPRAAAEIRG